jgi:LuxR family maltose regulon positive regulatory protein
MLELFRMAQKRGLSLEFSSRLAAAFAGQGSKNATHPAPAGGALSKREMELLRLIAQGCSNKEIAAQLIISIGTVKRHTVNIFTKLDVKNRTEAVARARDLGWM